jgi:hypothetical protein
VAEYNKIIERDILNLKNNLDRLSKEINDNNDFVKKVQSIREQYEEKNRPNLLENFVRTGKFLKHY